MGKKIFDNTKRRYIALGIFFLTCLGYLYVCIPFEINSTEINFEEPYSLNLSAGEITIITPENKTYTSAMSGYYPATHGFEDTPLGSEPLDWIIYASGGTVQAIEELGNHKNVVELYDDSSSGYVSFVHRFDSSKISGIVEFWVSSNDTSKDFYIRLRRSISERAAIIRIYNNYFQCYDSSAWIDVKSISNNQWYHFKIEFDCSTDTYDCWINGMLEADDFGFYDGDISSVLNLQFYSTNPESDYKVYVDAVGYSWDSSYSVGDNFLEGILLSFENDTKFDSISYSISEQNKRLISGNRTIPLPDDGVHKIKVYGRDSEDNIYESDYRYFTISTAPYIKWQAPSEDEYVLFPIGDPIFSFHYNHRKLDDVELEINNTNFGSVWNKTSILLSPYIADIDGYVTATLYGYETGNPTPIASDSRNFTFSKLMADVTELLDSGIKFIGNQLYLILHDPNGDNSYSGFSEGATFSMGSNFYKTDGTIRCIQDISLFDAGSGAASVVSLMDTSKGFGGEFRYVVSDTTQLTSNIDSSNKDYIGPRNGDIYWGEAWSLNWKLHVHHRVYFNGTERDEDLEFNYGIIRSDEAILNDYNAPLEWREINPVHNGWQNVEWLNNITVVGGTPYSYERREIETRKIIKEIEIHTSERAEEYLQGLTGRSSITLTQYNYRYDYEETEDFFSTIYVIYDDEPTDTIIQRVGVDKTFGTFIFQTIDSCATSRPLEYNTSDYIPPTVGFPSIELDSSQDGLAPCKDDLPIITVDIFDEGGIQSALILFSINDGINWYSSILYEQVANPGTWQGIIPAFDHGTVVLWYIEVWDNEGSYSNRTDPHGNPYRYTIINRAPTIHITTPNGNEIFVNTVRIEWSALDPDDDNLTFSIAYNLANTGWHLIETGITGNYYDWDISGVEFCDTVLVKVTVDDGFGGEAMDESDYVFTVGESAPSTSKPSEINWVLILVIGSISLAGAAFTIAIFIRRSRAVQE